MRLETIGISHRTSSIDVRDRAAMTPEKLEHALHALLDNGNLEGAVVLSTCNRTEIYMSPFHHIPEEELRALFAEQTGLTAGDAGQAFIYRDEEAVRHLFQVAAGLDSRMLGEVQILAQLRDAYHTALEEGVTNAVLNKVFLRAIECGKDVRQRTEISRGAVSVASASVKIAERIFGRLPGRRVLLVGAGQTSRLAAKYLATAGVDRWRVSNRTAENAQAVADLLGGQVAPYPPVEADLAWADVIVTATSAAEPVLTVKTMKPAARKHGGMQLVLDLAIPQDSEPAIGKLRNLYRYTVDDFEDLVAENLKAREREAGVAQTFVDRQVAEFSAWYRENRVAPTIQQLQGTLEELRKRELHRSARKFSDVDREQVDRFSRSLMRKVESLMIANLKRASLEEDDLGMAKAVARAVSLHNNGDVTDVIKRIDDELSHGSAPPASSRGLDAPARPGNPDQR